jgi:hypothetical protein
MNITTAEKTLLINETWSYLFNLWLYSSGTFDVAMKD